MNICEIYLDVNDKACVSILIRFDATINDFSVLLSQAVKGAERTFQSDTQQFSTKNLNGEITWCREG